MDGHVRISYQSGLWFLVSLFDNYINYSLFVNYYNREPVIPLLFVERSSGGGGMVFSEPVNSDKAGGSFQRYTGFPSFFYKRLTVGEKME
jgi:hypothetical protein